MFAAAMERAALASVSVDEMGWQCTTSSTEYPEPLLLEPFALECSHTFAGDCLSGWFDVRAAGPESFSWQYSRGSATEDAAKNCAFGLFSEDLEDFSGSFEEMHQCLHWQLDLQPANVLVDACHFYEPAMHPQSDKRGEAIGWQSRAIDQLVQPPVLLPTPFSLACGRLAGALQGSPAHAHGLLMHTAGKPWNNCTAETGYLHDRMDSCGPHLVDIGNNIISAEPFLPLEPSEICNGADQRAVCRLSKSLIAMAALWHHMFVAAVAHYALLLLLRMAQHVIHGRRSMCKPAGTDCSDISECSAQVSQSWRRRGSFVSFGAKRLRFCKQACGVWPRAGRHPMLWCGIQTAMLARGQQPSIPVSDGYGQEDDSA